MTAITIKTAEEIALMARANQIVAGALNCIQQSIKPGLSTWKLDKIAEAYALDNGSTPAFKGYRGYPASLCVSLNEQVVHGIPSKKVLVRDGDIVSIDFGVNYKGYYGDAAVSIALGGVSKSRRRLLQVTRDSLTFAIDQVRPGKRISDVSQAVQRHVEKNNFHVVKQFVGHGIGTHLHEAPEVPNYHRKGRSPRLLPGMVIAIEPMVNVGTSNVKILGDGWTVITADKSDSAHFEHSVAVTEGDPLVLSADIITKKLI
ncbi:Methionine aminopeptidase [hydrothermal vent metagenome]|uniref:Methionine aminopeptidase n=1 Tax=hydrothermal vent metagenome TaxID=652676 RepID=A0A3B0VKQ5_9ZZZZ